MDDRLFRRSHGGAGTGLRIRDAEDALRKQIMANLEMLSWVYSQSNDKKRVFRQPLYWIQQRRVFEDTSTTPHSELRSAPNEDVLFGQNLKEVVLEISGRIATAMFVVGLSMEMKNVDPGSKLETSILPLALTCLTVRHSSSLEHSGDRLLVPRSWVLPNLTR